MIEVTLIQRFHAVLLGLIAIGVMGAWWILVRSAFQFFKRDPMNLRAVALDRKNHKKMFDLVDEVAGKLSATPPDNIIAGLEPNFFVTIADVRLIGQDLILRGKTLFISLGLLRTFDVAETQAVVGHELGHFRGDDVAYTMKFAPVYSRLGHALSELTDTSGTVADLGRLPAVVALSMCLSQFSTAERTVGRQRELLADAAGAEASSALALARALIKVSLYSPQWSALNDSHIAALTKGRMIGNIPQVYAQFCAQFLSEIDWNAARDSFSSSVQSHPIDTHPPLQSRLVSLGISAFDIAKSHLQHPDQSASTLIDGIESIEEELSMLEARWLVATGEAELPETPSSTQS